MAPTGPRRSRRPRSGELAALLAARRADLGLTQREVAELTGVSRRTVQELERGASTVGLDVLLRVLDALGLTLAVVGQAQLPRLRDAGLLLVLAPPDVGAAPAPHTLP